VVAWSGPAEDVDQWFSHSCIVRVVAGTTTALDVDALARVGLALADDSRRRLMAALVDGPGYPSALADELGLTRANVSNHLSCLRGCGLVVAQAEGRRVRYELADPKLARALRDLLDLVLVLDPSACPSSDDDACC
jgi:ArsR family transcriptional regulator, cadmium/lead-responsive transcriptional repressor